MPLIPADDRFGFIMTSSLQDNVYNQVWGVILHWRVHNKNEKSSVDNFYTFFITLSGKDYYVLVFYTLYLLCCYFNKNKLHVGSFEYEFLNEKEITGFLLRYLNALMVGKTAQVWSATPTINIFIAIKNFLL